MAGCEQCRPAVAARAGVEPARPRFKASVACRGPGQNVGCKVTREGLAPSRHGGHGLLKTACLPFHQLAHRKQWSVEEVELSFAGCEPIVFPLADTSPRRTLFGASCEARAV